MKPICGAQKPSEVPGSFDWWLFGAVAGIVGAVAYIKGSGIPVINGILKGLGYAPAVGLGPLTLIAAFVGAAAIVVLVVHYAFKPDGCIRSLPHGQPVCFSGIVEQVSDTSSRTAKWLAPFAIPPERILMVVVKSSYWHLVSQSAFWVYCSSTGAAMLPCVVKSEAACGGKIGSVVGVGLGAIAGVVLGYVAAAFVGGAIGCVASGPFYLLCLLVVLLVAAIVAAAAAYAGAVIGGWIGQGIDAIGEDPVGDTAKALPPGAIVTVRGNWVTNDDIGNNEIYYVTQLDRNGQADAKPSFTTEDADATAADDCLVDPPVIK